MHIRTFVLSLPQRRRRERRITMKSKAERAMYSSDMYVVTLAVETVDKNTG